MQWKERVKLTTHSHQPVLYAAGYPCGCIAASKHLHRHRKSSYMDAVQDRAWFIFNQSIFI